MRNWYAKPQGGSKAKESIFFRNYLENAQIITNYKLQIANYKFLIRNRLENGQIIPKSAFLIILVTRFDINPKNLHQFRGIICRNDIDSLVDP